MAKQYGLIHEVTPLMDHEQANNYGRISLARAGSGLSSDSRNFAVVLFDPKTQLYEGFELSDPLGQRYLIRKTGDVASHIAPLDDIHDEVVRAWKREKARPLALKAAEELANRIKSQGGQIKELSIDNRPVIAVEQVTKFKPGMPVPSRFGSQFGFERGPAMLTDLVEIRMAGEPLLDTLFALKPGEVAIEPDLPKENYYVMTLEKRDPVAFMALMGPNGSLAGFKRETQEEIYRKAFGEGMTKLRERAGYRPEDYPSERQDQDANREG